jgi:DNA-binding Xre family transcriptional regulator
MLAEQFGILIRDRRSQEELKQVDLARDANVSRTVLSRLEKGHTQAVQTDVLDRICRALGLNPMIVERSSPNAARKVARLELENRLAQRRIRHYQLAIQLATNNKTNGSMIESARRRVELWRTNETCSPYYIERWAQLLGLPPKELALAMSSLGEWEDALFQNSPWSPE